MGKSMLDFINLAIKTAERGTITYEEWCRIRNYGSPEELKDAVERMEAAGGYANLE